MGTEDPNKMPYPASIFERIAEAFISLDKNWGITYINKKAGELINRDPLSLIGKNIWKEFSEAISVPIYTIAHKAMEDQQDVHVEEYYPPFNTWYKIDFYPSPEGSFFFFCDINRRKKQEEEIRR